MVSNIERDMRCEALALLYAANQRIAALERQLAAARDEIRRIIKEKVES